MQENFHHMALSAPTMLDEDLLYLALSGGTTNTERWSEFTPWTIAMKGHNLDSFHDSDSISISYDVPSEHVYFDFPCAPLCLSLHTYNPMQEGNLCYVVGIFKMHKDYWEKEKKKGATNKNSSRKPPPPKLAELHKRDYREEELHGVLDTSG